MVHQHRKDIFMNYLKGNFLYDLIIIIPFFISKYNIPYANFMLLLRISRLEINFLLFLMNY